ncbi:MAG: glycosyltransferase family 4 protein [Bifidobacteriaceae bacterium]|jgi:glycosyltransferase involved in cell wall biosynthesis|nr:glycosyltransferase family 4 protein [Bifidobacteriaceae bacterium]
MANTLAAVNTLARRGHEVTVLSAGADTFELGIGADWDLVRQVDPRVRVVRVDQPGGSNDPIINRWPDLLLRYHGEPPQWLKDIDIKMFPEPVNYDWYPAWLPNAIAAARQLHDARPFDLVVATILPAVSAGVALSLNATRGVPLVLYERDSWVFSPFTGEPYEDSPRSRPLLEQVFERAHQVWYINRPIADLHRREFAPWAHKIREVRNGWDAEFLPEAVQPRSRKGRDGLVFRYVGTADPGFPWLFIVEAWRQARAASPLVGRSRLEFVGVVADFAQKYKPIEFPGPAPRSDLPAIYADTDVLLFIKEGGPMATSSKIYEYTATGLPIASSMAAEHDARRVLEGRPLWFDAAEHTPEGLARALVAAAEHDPTAAELAAARTHGEAFRRDRTFDAAFQQLEESLGW